MKLKHVVPVALALCFSFVATAAYAGTIRGNSKTRHWCEVNGENISVSPTEPPSQTWKDSCKQAGGKIVKKGGLVKAVAIKIRTKAGGDGNMKVLKKLRKNNRSIKAIKRKIRQHSRMLSALKRKLKALHRSNKSAARKLTPSLRGKVKKLVR